MIENAKSMKDRMSLLEAENMELRARVSELEGNQNVAPHTQIPVFPTNVTQQVGTEATNETLVSPIAPRVLRLRFYSNSDAADGNRGNKHKDLQTSASSPLSTLFENGADVEIATSDDATCRIWYPGNAFYKKGWSSGQVRMILGENTFSVYLNSSMETLEFKASDLRIHRKWLDGVWKMADETDIRNGVEMLKVEYSTRFRDIEKRTKKLQESVSIDSIHPQPPPGDIKGFELMDKVQAYHNDGWCSGEVHIILSNDIYYVRFNSSTEFIQFNLSDPRIPKEWVDGVWKMGKEGKLVVRMKRKATAQPVDRLAFLQREEKRPIVPSNPPMHVTPEVILPIDPFVTPEFPLFSRLGYWMQLCGIHYVPLYINGNKIEKDFFEYLDYAENNLKKKHVDAAFAMLNQKRIEQSSWFSEQGIPKACFVPVQFLETVGYSYENLQKPDKKGINILQGWGGEVVRGLIRTNKMWILDVDIVYGVVHERLVDHFIGVEIHPMENTITIFHCGAHKDFALF
ncbi:hypothetical protein Bca52824_052435 [Brassica carinata]|uniref:Agenet domain-containing protein n=1 Tax=Brassica carinata TaxID=52824 RepID=A0A8X7R6A2_BRACI|nr:hypothetical protein Bca52824_052435 [Brassica carinata]